MFHRIPLPTGLERTLEELAREVLRRQPDDIYRFCHRFFQHRLEQREGEGRAAAELCEEHLSLYWPVFLSVDGADSSRSLLLSVIHLLSPTHSVIRVWWMSLTC